MKNGGGGGDSKPVQKVDSTADCAANNLAHGPVGTSVLGLLAKLKTTRSPGPDDKDLRVLKEFQCETTDLLISIHNLPL